LVAQRTRDYEIVMVLSPEATEEEISEVVERVGDLIGGGGGSLTEHNVWGLRPLAYPIKNFQEGNYVLAKFSVDADSISELNRTLQASEDIVRFLITKV